MHYTGCCFLSKMSITLFEHDFKGKQLTLRQSAPDLRKENFNDKASSVEVSAGFWRLWEHINYAGRFWIVGPGRYGFSELSEKIGNDCISSVEKLPTIQLYEHAGFQGRELTLHNSTPDLRKLDFNDKASSVVVSEGQWKLWEHINYTGKFFCSWSRSLRHCCDTGEDWKRCHLISGKVARNDHQTLRAR